MLYFVFATILVLVILGGIAATKFAQTNDGRAGGVGAIVAGAVLLLIITLVSSFTIVGARSVGVEVAFGKYNGTLDSGPHLTAPWASVEQFSTRDQYLDLEAPVTYKAITIPGDVVNEPGAVQTTNYGGDGRLDATVRWRIDEDTEGGGAENLWRRYKTFDNVREQLVKPTAKESFRLVTSRYTPAEAKDGANIRAINEAVVDDLNEILNPKGIVVDSISIKDILLGEQAQRAVDRVVSADADIDRAAREQERARIDAETAKLRAAEGALTPEALARYCLEVTNAWNVANNGPLPATWNCTTTGSNSVLVNTPPR